MPKLTEKIEVLRLFAELHADGERRSTLNLGSRLLDEATKEGLISWDDAGIGSFMTAIDRLDREDAIAFEDFWPEPRRPGEPMTAPRFSACQNFDLTFRGHEVVKSLGLLGESEVEAAAASRRRRYEHAQGERLGRWSLLRKRGLGGNAEVWEAADATSGETVALKILRSDDTDPERYARFRREVETVRGLNPEKLGILPLVDSSLPESLAAGTAWYAMPVALDIQTALRRATLGERVAAMIEIAKTLADLAAAKTYHRDVKPSNLYQWNGRFVVGDFGLVKRFGDEDLTRPAHVPGPSNFLPNEAIVHWKDAEPEAIDVYCLAKTLWALAAGEKRPPGGQIRADSVYAVSERLSDEDYVTELDRFIQRATDDDPAKRLGLARFAADLAHWLEARDIRGDVAAYGERMQELDQRVRRWVVELTSHDETFGRELVNCDDPNAPSPISGVSNLEFTETLVRQKDLGYITGEPDSLEPQAPSYWAKLRATFWAVEEVIGLDAMRARILPLLRTMLDPPNAIYLSEGGTADIGGVSMAAGEAYFLLDYANQRGHLHYRLWYETGGATLTELRVTAQGRDLITAVAADG